MIDEQQCQICGSEPARMVTIRRHVGMLLMQRFVKIRAPFCRDCGRKTLVQYTTRTLWQGWWGYISFFVNWFVLAANLGAFLQLRGLPQPRPSAVPTYAEEREDEDRPGISAERWRSVFGDPAPESE